MHRERSLSLPALLATVVCLLAACSPAPDGASSPPGAAQALPLRADIVALNGGIYTVDDNRPWVEALAVVDGAIAALGDNEDIEPWIGAGTRVIDLSGRMLLPGFHDAHVHPLSSGRTLLGCALNEQETIEDLLATLAACARSSAEPWVQGLDFNLGLFPDGNPDKALLDEILPDRPAYLIAADGHSAWVNSRALALAGITAETPDPPKGVIERDPLSGEPTGTLRESAQYLVSTLLPQPTAEDNIAALRAALAHMHRRGITAFIAAAVGESAWQAYHALQQAGELNARVTTSLTYGAFSETPDDADFDAVLARRERYAGAFLRTDAVKLFLDGVLEGETAALVEPYLSADGEASAYGELNFTQQELDAAVSRFMRLGLQIHMHAIGDGAVRAGLDAIEAAQQQPGITDNRPHIAHLQLVHPDDIPRFAALGVTANFQALWAYPDTYITDINLPAVGPERVARMYPIGSLQRSGARIVGGSDWSVSSVNPLLAIETAIRRQDPEGMTPGVLNAGEAVDLATMVAAYTREAAWLMRQDAVSGRVATGMRADLVVLDRNLFEIPGEDISEAKVLLTLFDGRVVYEAGP
ncbi:MAG: amidohydrolase [Halieaceae bacterium]|jgi:predicted amidohydrolase YtcJ|nr:amidohydrolase [Halieaceae bacterium]